VFAGTKTGHLPTGVQSKIEMDDDLGPGPTVSGRPGVDQPKNPTIDRMRRNLTRLASGSILAQAVVALSTPILTRLFAPEAFGVAALFTAAYGLLIPLVTLKYDQAVVMPKDHDRARSIGAMAMVIATVSSGIVGVGILAYLLPAPAQRPLSLLLLPVALWLGAAYTLMQQWSSRLANYTHYARSQVFSAVVNVSICIGGALLFSAEPFFIVLGFTVGMGVALAYTVWGFEKWPYDSRTLQRRGLGRLIKAYRNFPALVLPTALITVIGANGIPFILASHYSLEEVGVFAVANRVMVIPAAIVGGALAEAVRSEFAASQRARERVTPVFKKAFTPIFLVAGVLFAGIYVAAPGALNLVFGAKYAASGATAQALALAAFSYFSCAPFAYVFAILHRPAMGLLGQVLLALLPMGALMIFSRLAMPLNSALALYSLCTLTGGAIMLTLVYTGCKTFDAKGC
jgi:O-antigen/teichoic acid export membrane protein